MFRNGDEALAYARSLQNPIEALLLEYMLTNAVCALVIDPDFQESLVQHGPMDLLLVAKAMRASTRTPDTLSEILSGKIKSLDETPYAW